MSATLLKPPPTPGLLTLLHVVSCEPRGEVNGEPTFKPWPGIVLQLTPSVRPALAQVTLFVPMLTTPEPGKVRYFAAMLPEGAKAANAGVSYQPFEMLAWALGLRTVSQAKNANSLSFQIGPPPLAPNWEKKLLSLRTLLPWPLNRW